MALHISGANTLTRMPVAVFVMISLIWGSSFILMKKAALLFGPLTIGWLRMLLGLVTLIVIVWWRREWWRPQRDQWLPLLVLVFISFAAPYCVQPYLIAHHGSGYIGMWMIFVPLLTVVAQLPLLGHRATLREMVGVIGGMVCLWFIVNDGRERAVPLLDLLLAFTVPAGYAIGNVMVKRSFADVPSYAFTGWCLALSTVFVLPVMLMYDPWPVGEQYILAWSSMVLLGVAGTGLALLGLYYLIQKKVRYGQA